MTGRLSAVRLRTCDDTDTFSHSKTHKLRGLQMKNRFIAVGASAMLALVGLQAPALGESPHYVAMPGDVATFCAVPGSAKYWYKWTDEDVVSVSTSDPEIVPELDRVNNAKAAKEVWRFSTWSVTTTTTTVADITYHDKVCSAGHRAVIEEKITSSAIETTSTLISSVILNPGKSK
jgi:hypothetical protein